MSTFIVHLLIPPLMALAVGYFPSRYVWAWVWVSVFQDLDYAGWVLYVNDVVPLNTHRALFHNVFLLAALIALAYRGYRRYALVHLHVGPAALRGYAQSKAGAGWILSGYYYASHLLLDLFQGGIVPLFPFSTQTLAYRFVIDVDTQTNRPSLESDASLTPGVVEVSEIYPWLDSEQFAFILLFLLSLFLGYLYRRRALPPRIVSAVPVAPSQRAPPPRPGRRRTSSRARP